MNFELRMAESGISNFELRMSESGNCGLRISNCECLNCGEHLNSQNSKFEIRNSKSGKAMDLGEDPAATMKRGRAFCFLDFINGGRASNRPFAQPNSDL